MATGAPSDLRQPFRLHVFAHTVMALMAYCESMRMSRSGWGPTCSSAGAGPICGDDRIEAFDDSSDRPRARVSRGSLRRSRSALPTGGRPACVFPSGSFNFFFDVEEIALNAFGLGALGGERVARRRRIAEQPPGKDGFGQGDRVCVPKRDRTAAVVDFGRGERVPDRERSGLADVEKPKQLQRFAQSVDVCAAFLGELADCHPFGHANRVPGAWRSQTHSPRRGAKAHPPFALVLFPALNGKLIALAISEGETCCPCPHIARRFG